MVRWLAVTLMAMLPLLGYAQEGDPKPWICGPAYCSMNAALVPTSEANTFVVQASLAPPWDEGVFSMTIDWGDGEWETLHRGDTPNFEFRDTYAAGGRYEVSVDVFEMYCTASYVRCDDTLIIEVPELTPTPVPPTATPTTTPTLTPTAPPSPTPTPSATPVPSLSPTPRCLVHPGDYAANSHEVTATVGEEFVLDFTYSCPANSCGACVLRGTMSDWDPMLLTVLEPAFSNWETTGTLSRIRFRAVAPGTTDVSVTAMPIAANYWLGESGRTTVTVVTATPTQSPTPSPTPSPTVTPVPPLSGQLAARILGLPIAVGDPDPNDDGACDAADLQMLVILSGS